jgi:hypothetical protein
MSSPGWLSWLLLLMGLATIVWHLRLWYKPASLRPDSLMYRYIYFRWFAWRQGTHEDSVRLSDKQIRQYAVGGVVVGIVVVILAVIAVR